MKCYHFWILATKMVLSKRPFSFTAKTQASMLTKTDRLSKTCCGYLYQEQREPRSMAFIEPVDAGISLPVLGGVGQGTPDLCAWPGYTVGMETGLFHQSHASTAAIAQQHRGG